MKAVKFVAMLLMVIGALNWGLVGLFGYDVVAHVFGGMDMMGTRVVYTLIGLAGLMGLGRILGCCGCGCSKCGSSCNCDKK